MTVCRCVYLHGFLSSANSYKGGWFRGQLPRYLQSRNKIELKNIYTPTYPFRHPQQSVDYLMDYIERLGLAQSEEKWFLIGSSMGGFYARYLSYCYQVPCIMINPALDPAALLQDYQGRHTNPFTVETVEIDRTYCEALKDFYIERGTDLQSLLLLDKGDEVIDYQNAYDLFRPASRQHRVKLFHGGNHAFQHLDEAKQEIADFLEAAFEVK